MSNNRETSFDINSSRISHRRNIKSRFSYINGIVEKLTSTTKLWPEPNEEQLYQEALGHLVHVLSTKKSPVLYEGFEHSCKNEWCSKTNKREERMEEILNKLKHLERRRLYDPPSDGEIGYYHLIKKYIRSMAIFFTSRKGLADIASSENSHTEYNKFDYVVNDRFDCVTTMKELHYLEELEEGNRHLEQFSAYLIDMNVINGCHVKQHLLGITEVGAPEVICGSKEKNNMFYHHKFKLALLDLVSSHYAFSHPYPEEKKCYEQILILPPPQPVIKEVSVYSDHLRYQFLVKVLDNISTLEKHCAQVGNRILAKLSVPVSWEDLAGLCTKHGVDEEEDEGLLCFINESLEKCNISSTQLQDYVKDVYGCIQIAHYISEFLRGLRDMNSLVYSNMRELKSSYDSSLPYAVNLDWQALHAFTLFKNGSPFPVNELGKDMLGNGLELCSKKKNQAALSERREEDENGSLEMLKAILEEIRMIGDWSLEPLPTCKEDQILLNICRRVTSSAHFFLSATAYEQRTHVMQHGCPSVRRTGRKRKREEMDLFISFRSVNRRWGAFIFMLEGYKDGLLQKLNNFQE